MVSKHLSILYAGALTAAILAPVTANAMFVSGTFEISAYNYAPRGDDSERKDNSQATAANFDAFSEPVRPTRPNDFGIGRLNGKDTFTYIGALDFRVGSKFDPDGDGITTISEFLGTGSGSLSDFDADFGALTNSAGQGSGDAGMGGKFVTTTLYKITASSLNVADLSDFTFAKHDDGVTFLGSGETSVGSVGPNSEKKTDLSGLTGGYQDFTLYYASANGNPSVLEVNAIPLPAAAWLLMFASGGLLAAKRRQARRAA